MFRFSNQEIRRLFLAFEIPKVIKLRNGVTIPGDEALCILLRRLCYPNRYCDLERMFNRDATVLSRVSNWLTKFIVLRFGHLLTSLRNHGWLDTACLQYFAETLSGAGSAFVNCVGFIDGTGRPICRPKRGQKLVYSGYKKTHVLKYQSIVFPNGLIGRLDGPYNGRRHDAAILHLSNLLPELEQLFVKQDGSWFTLYGDPGYSNQKFIKIGFRGGRRTPLNQQQQRFNADMSALRVHVEYGFGKIVNLFAFVDYKKNQKLLLQPIPEQYQVAALLTNCHTCLRGSQVSKYFSCNPPELEQYLGI